MGFFAKNVGFEDKFIRILIGVLFFLLGIKYSHWYFVISFIAFVTAIFGWCGFYALFKINTLNNHFSCSCKAEQQKKKSKKKR